MDNTQIEVKDQEVKTFHRHQYENDNSTFHADAYSVKGHKGIAWSVLGWELEPNEDTEWSGYYNRSGNVLAIMVGDDRVFAFEPDELTPINETDYCHVCGQIGCTHDGLDRS
jgi:hypothetical protein